VLKPDDFNTHNVMGLAYFQIEQYEAAVKHFELVLKLKPGNFNTHNIMGLVYFEIKQDEAAAKHFELALKFASKDQTNSMDGRMRVHYQLGLVRSRQKKFDLAIVQFEESLKLNDKQPDMLNALAQTLLACRNPALKNPHKALELAQKACMLTHSKYPGYLNTLAVAYATVGNFSEAIKTSEKAVALAQAKGDQALVAKLQKQLYLIKRALAEPK